MIVYIRKNYTNSSIVCMRKRLFISYFFTIDFFSEPITFSRFIVKTQKNFVQSHDPYIHIFWPLSFEIKYEVYMFLCYDFAVIDKM